MNIEFGHTTVNVSTIFLLIILIGIIYALVKWGKELNNRRFTIFLYFFISTYTVPLYTRYTENSGKFELWFPLGFVLILIYLYANKKNHPAKMKASLLGFAVACYKLIEVYWDSLF